MDRLTSVHRGLLGIPPLHTHIALPVHDSLLAGHCPGGAMHMPAASGHLPAAAVLQMQMHGCWGGASVGRRIRSLRGRGQQRLQEGGQRSTHHQHMVQLSLDNHPQAEVTPVCAYELALTWTLPGFSHKGRNALEHIYRRLCVRHG